MVIDARQLALGGYGTKPLPVFSQGQAKDIVKIYDNSALYDGEEMAPPGKDKPAANTDRVDVRGIREVRMEYGYNMDYTKERAVKNAWANSQNTMFRLYGNSGRVSDSAVVDMSPDDFSEYMKTHELDRDIDWGAVGSLLKGNESFGTFEAYADYAGALAASLEDRIMTDFSGNEQSAQLDMLNSVFDSAVNSVIKSFDGIKAVWTGLGAPLPENKLEDSIRDVMAYKRSSYRDYIGKNADYAQLSAGDGWLRRDVGYMANALRNAHKPADDNIDRDLWSESDILAVGMVGALFAGEAEWQGLPNFFGYTDEESVGLSLAVKWLSKERVLSGYGASEDIRKLSADLFEKSAYSLMDRTDRANSLKSRDAVEFNASASAKLDRSAVKKVVQLAADSYNKTGNAKTAIQEAASYARETHVRKANYPFIWGTYSLHGGTGSKNYWENFYDSDEGIKSVLARWDRFDSVISSKDAYKIMRSIGSGVMQSALGT